ncbi:MAG: hypothetical protein GKR87_00475 [Kiritimatiellae bacterium]|nr:hypothetical protein [Kiritimatiellia bacterium]
MFDPVTWSLTTGYYAIRARSEDSFGQSDNFQPDISGVGADTSGKTTAEWHRDLGVIRVIEIILPPVDLDIDSDNNNRLGIPDRSTTEDEGEDVLGNSAQPGKFIEVSTEDADNDNIPDFADGFNLDGMGGNDDDTSVGVGFIPLVFELAGVTNLEVAENKAYI